MNISFYDNFKYFYMKRPYLSDFRIANTVLDSMQGVYSGGISFHSQKRALLSAIGEILEREMLIENNLNQDKIIDGKIRGYSILRNEEVAIDKKYVFPTPGVPLDSCGLASHIDSYSCISNALDEFIERQSYLLNYLTKTGGIEIDCREVDVCKKLYNRFENIKFYNISIIDDYYVILVKALKDNDFYIGMGSSHDIDKALSKAMKEFAQCDYAYNVSKIKLTNKKSFSDMKFSDYADIFFNLPAEKIWNAYSYLDGKTSYKNYGEIKTKELSFSEIIKRLNEKFLMDPIIIFLEPLRVEKNYKIVKVIDKNWFTTLQVKSYSSEKLDYIEKITGKKIDRKCTFIPFP